MKGITDIMDLIKMTDIVPMTETVIKIEIKKNEFVGIYGAYSEDFINRIATIKKINQGNYIFNGISISEENKDLSYIRNQFIGIVSEFCPLIKNRTVLENVALPFIFNREVKNKKIDYMAQDALELIDILTLSHLRVVELSEVERVLVLLARAIVNQPKVLVIGNIIERLETYESVRVLEKLKLLHTQGYTIIIDATYDLARTYCEKIINIGGEVENEENIQIN